MKKIMLPRQLDGPVGRDWGYQLASVCSERLLTLDFSRVEFACPSGILMFGREVRRLVAERRLRRQVTMVAGNDMSKPVHSFLSHVGFFDFIGLPNAKPIGAARGSGSYVPIRRFTRSELTAAAGANSKRMRENIAAGAEDIAAVVAGGGPDVPAYWPVAYSVREVIRNVFEHSRADECYVIAQKWANGEVEMGVLDEGIGIRASLAETFPAATDADALSAAIKPGVSRSADLSPQQNENENSGFGLYVLSELGRCFGRFTLTSGTACLTAGRDGTGYPATVQMAGTAVSLRMATLPHSFSGTLEDIVCEGEKDAAANGRMQGASKASRSQNL